MTILTAQQPELPDDVRRWLLTALDHNVLVTDANLNVLGDPISCWTSLDLTLKFNEPGAGIVTVPGYPWIREQLQAGCRLVILRNRQVLMSGPYESSMFERSDDGDNAGDGKLTINFGDDLARVVARCAYANPALTAETQTTDNWKYVGNAETAMRTLVNLNVGPGALAARQQPHLVLGPVAGVGTSITLVTQRFEPLGEALRRAATAGGDLGFRAVQVDDNVQFQVYDPPDSSAAVRFSFDMGNLKYVGYERKAPTVTSALVGGQGEGADRKVIERTNSAAAAAWGRMEQLVGRAGSTAVAELNADGDQALTEGGESVRLAVTSMDTPTQRFGIDYDLGHLVAIEPWLGQAFIDKVLTVHIQVFATSGEVVSTTVGSQAAQTDATNIALLRQLDARVGRLERSLRPAAMVVTP